MARRKQDQFLHFAFGQSFSKDVASEFGRTPPFIVKYEPNESPVFFEFASDSETDKQQLEDWVDDNQYPVFTKLGRHNFYRTSHSSKKQLLVVLVHDPQKSKHRKIQKELHRLAKPEKTTLPSDVHARFLFGKLDGVEWKEFVEQYNVQVEDLPRVVIFDSENDQFYESKSVEEQ